MKVKFRHFRKATQNYGATIAWRIDGVVLPKENDAFSPYFSVVVGIAFQNSHDMFCKKEGRRISKDRLDNNQLIVKLYPDETIDHAIFREIRKLSEDQALVCKVPRKVYAELLNLKETPIPFQVKP